jgi:hypothetical protein
MVRKMQKSPVSTCIVSEVTLICDETFVISVGLDVHVWQMHICSSKANLIIV